MFSLRRSFKVSSFGKLAQWNCLMVFISDVKYYDLQSAVPWPQIILLNKEMFFIPITGASSALVMFSDRI